MKKLLALVLALVMTLGLATVGANAATFSDADSITYKEAVDVMSAIGVLDGMDGKFNPTGTLTREQGAKIIAYMILGKTAADSLSTTSSPFTDVAADRWSAGAIAFAASQGIIGGVGGNKFDPTGTLTGYAFAKMALVALGYRADMEGLTGPDWTLNTATLIRKVGLASGISGFVGSAALTREQAAQVGLNTLKATEVFYNTEITSSNNGTTSVGTNTRTSNVANTVANDYRTAGTDLFMQLVEDVFPTLKLTVVNDAAGRPANQWKLGPTSVGTYDTRTPIVTYTTGLGNAAATNATVTAATTGAGYTFSATGVRTVDYTAGAAGSATLANITGAVGEGVLVEVYANSNNEIDDIVVLHTYLARVTNKDTVNKSVTLSVLSGAAPAATTITNSVGDANKDFYEDLYALNKNDYVLLYASAVGAGALVVKKIVGTPTTATGTYTKVASGTYTIGGNDYKLNATGYTATAWTLGNNYDLLLDQYGNIISRAVAASTTTYAYVIDKSKTGDPMTGSGYYFKLLFSDGTIAWAQMTATNDETADAKLNTTYGAVNANDFVSYTKLANGYDIQNIAGGLMVNSVGTVKKNQNYYDTDNDAVYDAGEKYMNNSTVVIDYNAAKDTAKVYSGLSTMPTLTSTTGRTLLNAAGGANAKFIVMTNATPPASSDIVYVYATTTNSRNDSTLGQVDTWKVIKDGVVTTVEWDQTVTPTDNNLYVGNTYNDDGVITTLGSLNAAGTDSTYATDTGTAVNTLTGNNTSKQIFDLNNAGAGTIEYSDGIMTITRSAGNVITVLTDGDFEVYQVYDDPTATTATCVDEISVGTVANGGAFALAAADVVYVVINASGYLEYVIILDGAQTE